MKRFLCAAAALIGCGLLSHCGGGGGTDNNSPVDFIPPACSACTMTFSCNSSGVEYDFEMTCEQLLPNLQEGPMTASLKLTEGSTAPQHFNLNENAYWGAQPNTPNGILLNHLTAEGNEARLTGGPIHIEVISSQTDTEGVTSTRQGRFSNGHILITINNKPKQLKLTGIPVKMSFTPATP